MSRRRYLAATAVGVAGLSGCTDILDGDGNGTETETPGGQLGSGRSPFGDRPEPGGTSMDEMPSLSGKLSVYSGRGEALVGELVAFIEDRYDDLAFDVRYDTSSNHVNRILTEGQNSPADVFYSVNAGSLGALASEGRTQELPADVRDLVREAFQAPDGHWTGTSGRARTIPFNTGDFSEDEIPDDIHAFPDDDRFADAMGWAPTYGSFQAFVTAMRLLDGEEKTRAWLRGMMEQGVVEYNDEMTIANAVADGEIAAGFANHYYIQRALAARPDASLSTAFTTGDAGAIFNVAGAAIVDTADDAELAGNFVRHLLSSEAQEYFATTTFEYPLIPEVEPIGRLPTIDELNPPSGIDLSELSDLEPTLRLMRDVGVL
jgi:iron(III) transport system substrate-binding protein